MRLVIAINFDEKTKSSGIIPSLFIPTYTEKENSEIFYIKVDELIKAFMMETINDKNKWYDVINQIPFY